MFQHIQIHINNTPYFLIFTTNTSYRVEIYDANKSNDVTIYSDQGVDREYLNELVFSNLRKFHGRVNAYVYDNVKKKKVTAMFLDESITNKFQSV